MTKNQKESEQAVDYLDRVLHEAVKSAADTVELERVPEGLEVCFRQGHAGLATVIRDRQLENEIIGLLVGRAGLENRSKGKLKWNIYGLDRTITVEEYDSFGESCFRLRLPTLAQQLKALQARKPAIQQTRRSALRHR